MAFKIFLIQIVCSFLFISARAQGDVAQRIKTQLDNKAYNQIIREDAPNARNYSAQAVYYIGMAYFLNNDDDDCIKFMNLAIEKDPNLADAYYTKAISLSYIEEYEKAINNLQAAIKINATNSEYYTALGDVYLKNEVYDKALETYETAIKQKTPTWRAYIMIASVYAAQKKMDKTLQAFYRAKESVPPNSEAYRTALYNIGMLEILNTNYDKAESALKELIELSPDNYHAYSKLIQVYYEKEEYDKAVPYREKLYASYKAGLLKRSLKAMFCFDQFTSKDKRIEAYEKFDEPTKSGDAKYIFYIMGDNNNIEFKIQTEYSPTLKAQGSHNIYILCKEQNEYHATYNLSYPENPNYKTLKKTF